MAIIIARNEAEIEAVLQRAEDAREEGSKYPGMSFEQGITDFYGWLVGDYDENPMPEDDD